MVTCRSVQVLVIDYDMTFATAMDIRLANLILTSTKLGESIRFPIWWVVVCTNRKELGSIFARTLGNFNVDCQSRRTRCYEFLKRYYDYNRVSMGWKGMTAMQSPFASEYKQCSFKKKVPQTHFFDQNTSGSSVLVVYVDDMLVWETKFSRIESTFNGLSSLSVKNLVPASKSLAWELATAKKLELFWTRNRLCEDYYW